MTKRYTLSKQAKLDLKDIKNYIVRDSLDNAETFVREIAERFQSLADFPGMGRSYETLMPNLRGFIVGNYIIFYRPTKNGIAIERIISGYRDIEAIFLQDNEG
ncbi:type II toxin-antitoxin system RelE/ParE family toxin [Argonema antarcticum]|uniref:type II toxin-antitoxin system RelE/ParE family toxin n=1 Tax=Argonema antarcticum TaxID=2942763 RepID=UPI002011A395|nr:type II toxin-antitoxin system RelE/ParE family toxin [Argonema antarcticum]MCL1469874.1 type II toxin-antitoxin system RelE/ParE family toxin [Argonema antarcticum A004/B2]